MDKFEKENWPVEHVSKDIVCKNCTHQKKPIKVLGKTFERYTHGDCKMYDNKPSEILWGGANCPYFSSLNTDVK